jgi:RNAse (barnase) inhibitor barstar
MIQECFQIVEFKPVANKNTYVGEIDGINCIDVDAFLSEIAKSFRFPDYFGHNYNALEECINDLDWIDLPNYILYIKNYMAFLANENIQTKLDTLTLFRNACIEWANVPNFEGEDDFRKKANFTIYIERCEEINSDLKLIH